MRGKHYKQYLASMVTVELAPDVAQYFPDSATASKDFASCFGYAAFADT